MEEQGRTFHGSGAWLKLPFAAEQLADGNLHMGAKKVCSTKITAECESSLLRAALWFLVGAFSRKELNDSKLLNREFMPFRESALL